MPDADINTTFSGPELVIDVCRLQRWVIVIVVAIIAKINSVSALCTKNLRN